MTYTSGIDAGKVSSCQNTAGHSARGLKLALLLTLTSLPAISAAEATIDSNLVQTALAACAELPDGKSTILSRLSDRGWKTPEITNPKQLHPLMRAMASFVFANQNSDTSGEALGMSIVNAHFMAASVLGNSALPRNQPFFYNDGVTLGVMGLSMEKAGLPYCMMSGPVKLREIIEEATPLALVQPESDSETEFGKLRPYFLGNIGSAKITVKVFDPREMADRIERLAPIELPYMPADQNAGEFVAQLDPVSLVVQRPRPPEGN